MKDPVTLSDTTPYYEKHFLLIDDTPHAYVSAFREAQYEARSKKRQASVTFWCITVAVAVAWIPGFIPLLLAIVISLAAWALASWRNRHEARLLARTFELALRGKQREFHDYMWQHLDRRMLRQDF